MPLLPHCLCDPFLPVKCDLSETAGLTAMLNSGSAFCVWCIFANWPQCSAVQPFSQHSRSCYCSVLKAVADAGDRAGPGLDAELMPPEQPSGSRWWNRLPGRGGGGGLGSRGGSQGDLQHGEAPLSAAQQARDRLSRYSHSSYSFLGFSHVRPSCSHSFLCHSILSLLLCSMQCPHLALKPAVVLSDFNHITHAPVGMLSAKPHTASYSGLDVSDTGRR